MRYKPYRPRPAARPPAAPAAICELLGPAALCDVDEDVDWKRARAGHCVRPTRADRATLVRAVDLATFILQSFFLTVGEDGMKRDKTVLVVKEKYFGVGRERVIRFANVYLLK